MIPFADQIPAPLRSLARRTLPHTVRRSAAHFLNQVAQYQTFLLPRYRDNRARLKGLANAHRGEACVILGNGRSLAGIDPDLLRGVPTFGLNRGYLIWRQWAFTPSYYVAINDLVIAQFHDDIAALPCPKFLPWRSRHLFSRANNCLFVPQGFREKFGRDPARGLWGGGTVTFAALQLAWHMGFETAILVGVDHAYSFTGAPNAEALSGGPDPNHFDPAYFGAGIRWNLPDLARSERAYAMARAAYEADGRRIVNATEGSRLEIFERAPLEQALAGVGGRHR